MIWGRRKQETHPIVFNYQPRSILVGIAEWIERGCPIDNTAPMLRVLREMEEARFIVVHRKSENDGPVEFVVRLTFDGEYEVARIRAGGKVETYGWMM